MGNNFVTEVIWYRKGDLLNFKTGHDYIDGFSDDEIAHIADSTGRMEETVRDHLHACLRQIEGLFGPSDHDLDYTEYEFPPYNIYVTGGDSWGNDPTELFTYISELVTADFNGKNVLEVCGLNPETLDYREILMKILSTKALIPLLIGIDKNLDLIIEKEILHGKRKKSIRRKR